MYVCVDTYIDICIDTLFHDIYMHACIFTYLNGLNIAQHQFEIQSEVYDTKTAFLGECGTRILVVIEVPTEHPPPCLKGSQFLSWQVSRLSRSLKVLLASGLHPKPGLS